MLQQTKIWLVGSLVKDTRILRTKEHIETLGGPPYFACLFLSFHKEKPYIISKVGLDFPESYIHRLKQLGAQLKYLDESKDSMEFTLEYNTNDERILSITSFTKPICSIPDNHSHLTIVSPVYNEILPELFSKLANRSDFVALDPQGFFRHRNEEDCTVSMIPWRDDSILKQTNLLKLNERELDYLEGSSRDCKTKLTEITKLGPEVIAVTQGDDGVVCADFRYKDINKPIFYTLPAFPCKVIDETGAGDVFLAALAYSLYVLKIPLINALSRSVAISSLLIEQRGDQVRFLSHQLNDRAEFLMKNTCVETDG